MTYPYFAVLDGHLQRRRTIVDMITYRTTFMLKLMRILAMVSSRGAASGAYDLLSLLEAFCES